MRTAFVKQLVEEARLNEKVFFLVADLGYNVVEDFAKEFPDRFINVGIAEQNMAGIAAGLAKEGFIPFIYSIGNFPTLRCMEQIRYDICYHNLNVNIVAVGGGYAYGSLGTSHHTTEELGMLRTIPTLTVCAPADPIESRMLTTMAVNDPTPFYIRLGKNGEKAIHEKSLENYQIGEPLLVRKGETTAVLSTGSIGIDNLDFITENNINASVYTFPVIKPLNKERLAQLFNSYKKIITVEEHQASAGFGSAILECLNDLQEEGLLTGIPKVKRIAIKDTFTSVAGSQKFLKEKNGLILKKEYFTAY
ncbi:transketolase [Bacteroidales bacterium OttesenSCG-928-B11]|nr:transketolase [Bacteroidales bacterium OttesenSCG-928-E04]MDL2312543.1 transketolase [Bacteroidales bacterium OttesenSCG-928-B11]MDL2326500.1 transketolase [Bacteroidales bacterium OttesenSCG-928-A14]